MIGYQSLLWKLLIYLALVISSFAVLADSTDLPVDSPSYQVNPVGWVRKTEDRTVIEINQKYQDAMLGVEDLDAIWVLYWFDRNDTLEQRSILQVHPRADPDNPLQGVFATRAPVRPNLIALSRCRVLSVKDNIIEIDDIDAFDNTPVLDIKP